MTLKISKTMLFLPAAKAVSAVVRSLTHGFGSEKRKRERKEKEYWKKEILR